jgi:hypothetical protein
MTITLEVVKAEQEKLATMIAALEAEANKPTFFEYGGQLFPLKRGEIYVGTIITPSIKFHLTKLPGESNPGPWKDVNDWALAQGGELFDRVEGALLFQHLKAEFKEEAYWTRETRKNDTAYAWYQYFGNGYQNLSLKGSKLRGVAVRRLVFQ